MKPSLFVRLWLGAAALATAVAFGLTYHSIRQSEISNAWVDHTEQTLAALISLEGATADVILAADAAGLDNAASMAFEWADRLTSLTADNPEQQARVATLKQEIGRTVDARRALARRDATYPTQATVPPTLVRALREVRVAELALLTNRVRTNAASSRYLRMVLLVVAGGSGTLLLWVLGLVIRDERIRHQTEATLRRANEELDARVAARTAELHASLDRERALREEAEEGSRLKDEFLMTVSHELRTPLNALLGWADMLRLGIVAEGRRQRAADAIYENAKLQTQLIADLLDTARILTGKLRIETTRVDLGEIVREAVAVVTPAAQAKGLRLEVAVDEEAVLFEGDRTRLRQIVWNLVSNAVKFTSDGSIAVRVQRSESNRELLIVVADTGRGIGADFLPHVFERFRQERTGTTRSHGGLGLGLSIVRQLVELHGGTIRAESPGDGKGATFVVALPRAQSSTAAQVETTPAASDASALPALAGIRVLVVDDDAGAREMATAALEYCGAEVLSAASASEARAALSGRPCDVFLIDIAMPGEDGYALIRDVRSLGLHQPAAALTAQVRDSDREEALLAGFDAHIAKPVEAQTLAKMVARLVALSL